MTRNKELSDSEFRFWCEKLDNFIIGKNFVHSGNHYTIGNPADSVKGFAGARWEIVLTNVYGNIKAIETDNVWHQGQIPELFLETFESMGKAHEFTLI